MKKRLFTLATVATMIFGSCGLTTDINDLDVQEMPQEVPGDVSTDDGDDDDTSNPGACTANCG